MSKEEILLNGKMDKRILTYAPESIKHIYEAMDKWAEIRSIAFVKWVDDNYISIGIDKWIENGGEEPKPEYTTPQLYEFYKQTI